MDKINAKSVKELFARIKDVMVKNEDLLFKLDSEMGDGDLGITMSKGFLKVDEVIKEMDEEDIGKIFIKAGMTLASAVPSTMGTLMATGFMRAGKTVKGKIEVNLADFALMMKDFVNGIIERGKARPGDKTIIDSLLPASDTLEKASKKGEPLIESFKEAYRSSKRGVESTKEMVSKHGKALYHIERSAGKEDPGAVAGMLLIKAFYDYLKDL